MNARRQEQNVQKDPSSDMSHRRLGVLWLIATHRGRRVNLGVLLTMLVVMGGLAVRHDGYFGSLRMTAVFWLAFGLLVTLIMSVVIIDLMVIRLRLAAAQRELLRRAIAEAPEHNIPENDPP